MSDSSNNSFAAVVKSTAPKRKREFSTSSESSSNESIELSNQVSVSRRSRSRNLVDHARKSVHTNIPAVTRSVETQTIVETVVQTKTVVNDIVSESSKLKRANSNLSLRLQMEKEVTQSLNKTLTKVLDICIDGLKYAVEEKNNVVNSVISLREKAVDPQIKQIFTQPLIALHSKNSREISSYNEIVTECKYVTDCMKRREIANMKFKAPWNAYTNSTKLPKPIPGVTRSAFKKNCNSIRVPNSFPTGSVNKLVQSKKSVKFANDMNNFVERYNFRPFKKSSVPNNIEIEIPGNETVLTQVKAQTQAEKASVNEKIKSFRENNSDAFDFDRINVSIDAESQKEFDQIFNQNESDDSDVGDFEKIEYTYTKTIKKEYFSADEE